MIYAIISDIHGNLEALNRTVDFIESHENIGKIICLGDIVGYGANPLECIDITREISDVIIAGNHDYAAVDKTDINFFNPVAREAAIWTGKVLSPEKTSFLKNLPLLALHNNMHFAHGSLHRPEEWRYLLSVENTHIDFRIMVKNILFVGHSHIPITFKNSGDTIDIITEYEFTLDKKTRYIINPGSIGQPRDSDPRASFILFDTNNLSVKIIKLEYNIQKAQEKIKNAGLPEILAERLSYGR